MPGRQLITIILIKTISCRALMDSRSFDHRVREAESAPWEPRVFLAMTLTEMCLRLHRQVYPAP